MKQRESERPPNVVVFFTDQQRWDTTGVHGNPMGLTPNFDRLARRGTDVHYSFTCQPVCAPARSCLQTGRYATQTGVYRNGISIDPHAVTLATCFRDAGYATGYIGKWHLFGGESNAVPPEYRGGYEDWLASNILEFSSYPYETILYDDADREVFLPGYRIDAMTDAALRWIDRRRDRPFYLMLSFLEPHHQNQWDNYPAPEGYEERYRDPWTPRDLAALGGSSPQHLPGYYGLVRKLDEALGRVLDALRSLALSDDTIVLVSSDHGCHFKTRNGEYKRSPHESSIRVPTAIDGAMFRGGGRFDGPFSIVDIAPTLLHACSLPIPETMEGTPLAAHAPPDPAWPDDVFFQLSEAVLGRGVRTRRWKYAVTAPEVDAFAHPAAPEYRESFLYDLDADPHELTNLVAVPQFGEVRSRLRERLLRRIQTIEGYTPRIEPAEPPGAREPNSDNPQLWGMGQRSV